jgi:cobalt-zinc-cadmium efflux system membrane fusion protein
MKSALLLTAIALLMAGCFGGEGADRAPADAPRQTSAAIRQGDVIQFAPDSPQLSRIQTRAADVERVPIGEVVAPGRVEVNPNRVSRIAPPVAGRIRSVLVGLGDPVKEGQPIVVIESSEIPALQSAFRHAEATITQTQAVLARAEADLQRVRDLYEHRAIAQKEVLAAESAVAEAKAGRIQAEAARDEVAERLRLLGIQPGSRDSTVVVHASVSGKVTEISVAPGEFRTDTAQPLMTLADLSTVWVAADVPENSIRFIRIGEPVVITLPAFPDQTFSGRVTRMSDVLDPETRTIRVRAELSNPQGQLRPEMFAQIRAKQGERELPTIPNAALIQLQGRNIVYVEREAGKFQEVPITVFWHGPDRVAIEKGIAAGDRVVVDGAMLLRAAAP